MKICLFSWNSHIFINNFQRTYQFFSKIMHHSQVSSHITPRKIFTWSIIYFDIRSPSKCRCLSEIHQIYYVIFETHKSVFLQILHHFSVITNNCSIIFQLKHFILWTKEHIEVKILRLLIALVKIHQIPVCYIRKSLQVLQKAHIKIWPMPFTLNLFFSYTYTLLFCNKMKSCCDRYFPQQIRPQTTVQLYKLQDYSSVRIHISMINKRHTPPIV